MGSNLSCKRIDGVDSLSKKRDELLNVERRALGDNVLDQAIQQLRAVLHARVRICGELGVSARALELAVLILILKTGPCGCVTAVH